ncbi:MAG: substrate-binding domain-containing protein [Acutalibacter sp.]|nr:substrate-binding domain-containing protein [Acutalibacter sp.]
MNKSSFDSAKDLIAYHWTKGTEFDSVFACSDWRAYGALVALRNMGVKVPEDVKIVGYDGIRVSRYCDVPITTIQQNTQMLSQTVCDTLWNLMQNTGIF